MDSAIASPCEDKQTNGNEEAGEESGDQSTFGGAQATFSDLGFNNVVEVGVVSCYGNNDADCDAKEYEAHLSDIETVAVNVDQREDFEEGVEDCVTESDVDVGVGLGRSINTKLKYSGVDRLTIAGSSAIS